MASSNDRYVTMSIASLGDATLPRPDAKPFQVKQINDISDISGAKSGPKYQPYFNKPQFLQSDVLGSTSKPLTWSRNCRDNTLYIDDIDGTRHTINDRMMRTERHVDPLQPNYPLASYVPAEDPPVKFIKNSLDNSDIEGSKTKVKRQMATRDNMRTDDIAGAQPKQRFVRTNQPDLSNVSDISAPTHRFKDRTTRVTDPNNPVYHVNGMDYFDDKYTKPKPLKNLIRDSHLLQTKDIVGATPGYRASKIDRREYRNTNFIGDVEGAQADSIKHSITTKRQSNPLAPVYQSLDPGEILEPLIPPLIPPTMIKVPTVPVPKGGKKSDSPPSAPTNDFAASGAGEFDPVSFTSDVTGAAKPPSGRPQFRLDLATQQQQQGNGVPDASMYATQPGSSNGGGANGMSSYSPYNSGRITPSKLRSAAANSFNNNNSSSSNNNNNNKSPAVSARSSGGAYGTGSSGAGSRTNSGRNSGRATPAERRAEQERVAEINSVRGLRE